MDVLFVCNYLNVVYDAERSIIDVLLEYKCTSVHRDLLKRFMTHNVVFVILYTSIINNNETHR